MILLLKISSNDCMFSTYLYHLVRFTKIVHCNSGSSTPCTMHGTYASRKDRVGKKDPSCSAISLIGSRKSGLRFDF